MDYSTEYNWIFSIKKERTNIEVNSKELLFQNYVKPYITVAMRRISESQSVLNLLSKQHLVYEWGDKIAENLCLRLEEIAKLSLADYFNLELQNYEECKKCNEQLKDLIVVTGFEKKYPVIKKLIETIIEIEVNNIILMTQRLYENLETIYHDFNIENTIRINKIIPSLGDYHGRKLVAEVRFENGQKLIYKTRSGFGEKLLKLIFNELGAEENDLYIPFTQDYTEYIIQEFVQYDAYLNEQELKNFYWKFGVMAAIFTFLGASDMHAENIIATKKGPVFVDLETLIAPYLNDFYYNNSALLSTFLFMGRRSSNVLYMGMDISGFSGKGNQGMRMFTNIPCTLNGMFVDPYNYAEHVVCGFDFAKKIILKKKNVLCNKIKSLSFGVHRKVIRNTGFYEQFILASLLPQYTKSFSERQKLFDLLSKHSKYKPNVIEFEKESLKKLEIPFFSLPADQTDNELFEFILGNNLKEGFLIRIQSINKLFFEYETNVLLQLLSLKEPSNHLINTSNLAFNGNRIGYECRKFLRYTLKNGKLTYITIDNSISKYIIERTNDMYVFGGALCTVILYFNQYKKSPISKEIILNTLRNNSYSVNSSSGIFGVHSQLLLLKIIQKICGINEVEKDFKKILEQIQDAAREVYDFSGVGSSIIACALILKGSYYSKLHNYLVDVGEEYIEKALKRKRNSGLFHGYSGDILVLISLLNVGILDSEKYLQFIEKLLLKENELFSTEIGNWVDTRREEDVLHDMVAISYGAPGILFTRIILKKHLKKHNYCINKRVMPILEKDINLAINKVLSLKREDYYDDTLINGYTGAVLSLYYAVRENNELPERMKAEINSYIDEAKKSLEMTEWRVQGKKNIYFPNFMNGNMGIVFALIILSDLLVKEEMALCQK